MKKKKNRLWLWAGALLISGLSYWYITGFFDNVESVSGAKRQTVTVERRNIGSSVLATGIIKPKVGAEVRVGSRISGIVKRLYVDIGDHVEKGSILAELEPAELEARHRQADADLEMAASNLKFAEIDLKRGQALFEKKLVSQEQLNAVERTFSLAKAQVKQAQASLEFTRVQLGYTKINAPISGVVASVSTYEGETVAASFAAPTFATIINLNRLEMWAYVDETDIGRIEIGQRALFTVDTYSDVDFEGSVTAIYPKAEIQNNVVNYVTIVDITDTKGKLLRPEMTTSVTILLQTRENVLALPNKAIRRERGRKYVYVLEADQPVQRWIKIGWKDDNYTEITDGLEEGEVALVGEFEE